MGETARTEYLTVGQVAKQLNRSIHTIRRWEELGYLLPIERGPGEHGFRYYDPADIDAFVAKMRATARNGAEQ